MTPANRNIDSPIEGIRMAAQNRPPRRMKNMSVPPFVERRLRQWRWARRGFVALLVVLAASAAAGRLKGVRPAGAGADANDWATFDKKSFRVNRVVDGDTIYVRRDGQTVRIRMLGIDAPETRAGTEEPPDHWALNAKKALAGKVEGREVTLALEQAETRDNYGRLLAYVYVGDTENVNQWLVREGHVYADRRFKHTQSRQLAQVEAEARKKKLGLWKDIQENQMPAWRQRWLKRQRPDEP
jgi:endonuclease YncB( thermonuclease family)